MAKHVVSDVYFSLAKHVISTEAKDKNFVFSPPSIHVVLAMLVAGATGPARDQLLGYLKSKSTDELNSLSSQLLNQVLANGEPLGGPRLSVANAVWIDQRLTFKPAFRDIVENVYKAASNHVDFRTKADEVREEVNKWAEKETNGLIKDLIPPGSVNDATTHIFANAVYFKAAWEQQFKSSLIKDREFFLLNGSSIQVPFMTSNKKQYVSDFDGFKVLGLPYKQGEDERRFSMYIFLPDAKDGLPSLIERAGSESGFVERHIPHQQVKVGDFGIPKFKIAFGFEASEVLKKQGLMDLFSSGGLTEMVENADDGKSSLLVSSIIHKAVIEVNEGGTEAAAASAVVMFGSAMVVEKKKVDFVADHPFMFVIIEDVSGVVLFIGQLLNPALDG